MNIELVNRNELLEWKNEIIKEVTSVNQNHTPKKWLRSKEVRKILGNISPGTLQNMRIQGHIPFSKIGGTLLYDYDEITKILQENKSA